MTTVSTTPTTPTTPITPITPHPGMRLREIVFGAACAAAVRAAARLGVA
ncbi:methyltransferase, partial [Streptomyces sp. NPDC001937]